MFCHSNFRLFLIRSVFGSHFFSWSLANYVSLENFMDQTQHAPDIAVKPVNSLYLRCPKRRLVIAVCSSYVTSHC